MRYTDEKRESFQGVVHELYVAETDQQPTAEQIKVCRSMLKCNDMLPAYECDVLGIRQGSSYATGAREILRFHHVPPLTKAR